MADAPASSSSGAAPAPATIKLQAFPSKRLPKPHEYFPFDILSGKWGEQFIPEELKEELSYVMDHCMVPPFPWGHIIYTSIVVSQILERPSGPVPGNFAEFGIGQGGTSVYFARLAKKYGRKFLAVDSFEGLPPVDLEKENHYFVEGDYRAKDGVDNFDCFMKYKSRFDVEDTLTTLKGFFKDVAIPPEFDKLAFVHLDSDLYDSVYDSLVVIWDRLSPGGIVVIDDFFHHAQGPARAVADFFRKHEEEPPLIFPVPTYAVLIIKGQSACLQRAEPGSKERPVMYAPRALDGNFYSFKLIRECEPFREAAENSLIRIVNACQEAQQRGEDLGALTRARLNAESFYSFLRYDERGARSGLDIFRYLTPIEDLLDICQGSLCGMPGQERRTIEIGI